MKIVYHENLEPYGIMPKTPCKACIRNLTKCTKFDPHEIYSRVLTLTNN